MRIACIGEAMIELNIDRKPSQISFAGDTLNTAIYLRRALDLYHDVSFVSVIGNDPLSRQMENFIMDEGVSTSHLVRHPSLLPGIYSINKNSEGERSFHYWRDNSAAKMLFESGFEFLEEYDVVFLSGITLAILPLWVRFELLNWLEQWSGLIVFDSNYREQLWQDKKTAREIIERAWQICDIALPSLDDEMDLFDETSEQAVLQRFHNYGVTRGALKRGSKGPVPIDYRQEISSKYPQAKVVIDTTAAGDSFNGTFLAFELLGCSLEKSLSNAHQCAIEVIGFDGAIVKTFYSQ